MGGGVACLCHVVPVIVVDIVILLLSMFFETCAVAGYAQLHHAPLWSLVKEHNISFIACCVPL